MIKIILKSLIFYSLIFFTFFLFSKDIQDYGVTWDEFFHRGTGNMYYDFLGTGKLDEILKYEKSAWFPPLASTIGYIFIKNPLLIKLYPTLMDRFHLAAVFYGSMTIGFVFLISELLLDNLFLSAFASLLLIFHPQFTVNAHTNVRDMGLMMFYSFTILTLILAVKTRKKRFWSIVSGILAGMAAASKQNGFILLITGVPCLLINCNKKTISSVIKSLFLFILFFIAGFILFWPYLWVDTFRHLLEAWHFLTTPSIIGGTAIFYDKAYISLKNVPFYYPWIMLFILTPPYVGIFWILGLFTGFYFKKREFIVLYLWILIPLSRFLIPTSAIAYDQIRHFLEVLPTIPIFAAVGIFFLLKIFKNYVWIKSLIYAVCIIILVLTVNISNNYKPFGNAYFNIFAGPTSFVNHAFDVEYWGNVYRQAAHDLNSKYGKNVKYNTGGLGAHLLKEDGLLGDVTDELSDQFDYVIFMNKQSWIRNNAYLLWLLKNKNPIYTISREGKILFY
ncbi:glycosyltransferase family 39 protein, partial [Candidatus Gottesmanbacteria bacterium]|nr:glycosyltransferase family 39 protein [Candidatus Gottesmanbacteria bacterium]